MGESKKPRKAAGDRRRSTSSGNPPASPSAGSPPPTPPQPSATGKSRAVPAAASTTEPSDGPWYEGGLRFECTQCGDCCGGAPGYVWVNQAEIDALAERLEMDVEAFEKKFVRSVGVRRSLRELRNGDCVFLDPTERKCTVYEQRPRQCRTWPFWDSNLKNPAAWARTCEVCPGSGRGKLYQLDHIEQQRTQFHV